MSIETLNERSRAVFRNIVESYLETGDPVGSRLLSRMPGIQLSPASVRNVMADLEETGLLFSPHTSAGRIPTERGLRLFVDGLLQLGYLSSDERANIESRCVADGKRLDDVLLEATEMLSGLSHCAGMVMVGKQDLPLKHMEFVHLQDGRAMVVLVTEDGNVENRLINVPAGLPSSSLRQATNYLNARLTGKTFEEARRDIQKEIAGRKAELDELTARVVEEGLASWSGAAGSHESLIVRGRANLLDDMKAAEDLERIRQLFDDLESKKELIQLLELARDGEGVQIFIGSENKLFSLSGSSVIVAPYRNASSEEIVGVIGVIGPTRLNYARIIPMVDYTARVVGRIL